MGTSRTVRPAVAALLLACVAGAPILLLREDEDREWAEAEAVVSQQATATETSASSAVAAPKRDAPRRVAAAAASAETDVPRGDVVVRVTRAEDGTPIAGAGVSVGRLDATADAAGEVRFERLEACEWTIEATAPARLKRSLRRVIAANADTTIDLRLTAAAVLSVRVEDRANGAPITDAKIEADVVGLDFKETGTTGDDGERLLSAPAGSILRVSADATGYCEDMTSVRLGGGGTTNPVVLRLVRPGEMTGVVRAPDGAVVAGANVELAPESGLLPDDSGWWDSNRASAEQRKAKCDSAGRYSIGGLVRGRGYQARAAAADGTWASSETARGLVVPRDGGDVARDFTLREFGTVVARVTDLNGAPVADARVMLTQGNGIANFTGDQAEAGVHRLPRRAPGPIALFVWSQRGSAMRNVVVPSGGTVEVAVALGGSEFAKCVVVDETGRPVAGAKVASLATARAVNFKAEITTDESGCAAIPRVGTGVRRLSVTAPGMLPATVESDGASPDDVRVVMQRSAVLTFRVLGADGQPLVMRMRVLFGEDPRASLLVSGADGNARLDCEPRGEIDARLFFGAGAPLIRRVTLAPGAVADLGDVRLVPPREVVGRVVDGAGRPVEGARVRDDKGEMSSLELGIERHSPGPRSDADGRFEADFAPPSGPLPLVVSADGFVDLHTVVTIDGDAPLTLTLQRGGLLWGEVVEPTGGPRPGNTVRVLDARGVEVASSRTGPRGEFDVRVAPGRYTVRAIFCDDVSVELREGADEHVVLTERAR